MRGRKFFMVMVQYLKHDAWNRERDVRENENYRHQMIIDSLCPRSGSNIFAAHSLVSLSWQRLFQKFRRKALLMRNVSR